ncbi:MAG: hypothetical protein ABIA12_02690 [Candidatus Aenigmatarchaeota archaeon]
MDGNSRDETRPVCPKYDTICKMSEEGCAMPNLLYAPVYTRLPDGTVEMNQESYTICETYRNLERDASNSFAEKARVVK